LSEDVRRWLAKSDQPDICGDLPLIYGGSLRRMRPNRETLYWFVRTRAGAARLPEVFDYIDATWTREHVQFATRYCGEVWFRLVTGKIKKQYIAAAIQHGNVCLLNLMRDHIMADYTPQWIYSQMRHARTWRWLCDAIPLTSHMCIRLVNDPKMCLIVALQRAKVEWIHASMSAWMVRARQQ